MTDRVNITVDGVQISTEAGSDLLRACLDNGIFVPNLCYLRQIDQAPASCRMCFVEVDGIDGPVTSCTVRVTDGMVVKTDTPEVRRLQRSALGLLLSVHDVTCKECPANRNCALQELAKFLKVPLKQKRLDTRLKEVAVIEDHPFLSYFPNRCILCGRCVAVCRDRHNRPLLSFAGRGFDTVISAFGHTSEPSEPCVSCRGCAEICPVGALVLRESAAISGE